ncbi:type II toxin-antitoxin system RelB/DinJ family antitoxin [Bifidobacterium sp. ESL0764]|uniref:type II toxin-antitoxin system RelB/DinJ family antitoxin n=1 Tax=Bifidobacterium sp. ESL0764 TaxID=2983228 RepID=UPI0023FA3C8D|nr:type II toxin-antitoxin system RelB/DinJ family antitoxin [Bifidobacterium sp. ESL0764]WEV66533.1 type II toxin-antitoxin system RelB/DinJ family antitoxin [Bifidobacterium sp. ESL0764]
MRMATVTVRVDEQTKKMASALAEEFGFDLSSVTRAFYKQMIREQSIPLNLTHTAVPNEATKAALREASQIHKSQDPGFSSADEMFSSLGI